MRFPLIAALALILSACGSDRYGYWKGTHTGTQAGTPIDNGFTLLLRDEDSPDNGVWISYLDDEPLAMGHLQADGEGDQLSVTFTQDSGRCVGTYSGTLTIAGTSMTGALTGTSTDLCTTTSECSAVPGDLKYLALPFGIPCGALTWDFALTKSQE